MAGAQYNAGDKVHVQRRKLREQREQKQSADDIRAVMATEEGRRFVHGILINCGCFQSAAHHGDAAAVRFQDFKLGQQEAGFQLQAAVEQAAPVAADLMFAEARQRQRRKQADMEAEETPAATDNEGQGDG